MKIKTTKNNSKKILILVALVIIASVCFGLFYVFSQNNRNQTNQEINISKESSEKSSNSNNANKSQSSDEITTNNEKNLSTNSDTPQSPVKNSDNSKYSVKISTHIDSTAESISIRGLIDLSIEYGFCDIILTSPKGVSETKQTEILMSPTTSSCKTLTLPKSNLEKGTWKYKIKYETSEITGESNENTFEV